MLNGGGILLFDEESLQSSSSSTASSPTSTESSFLSSSNSENLNPTANWNLNDSLSEPTTTTFDDYSFPSSGSQGSSDGIYVDHPDLNPSSENIGELQSAIHNKLGEVMINRSPKDVLVVVKTVFSFLDSLLNDLNIDGVQGEAYTERQELSFSSGNMEPVGVKYSSVAGTSSRSPVESEEIVASADSFPSPMIRLPPPQPPLPRTNCYVPIVRWRSQLQLDSRERIVNKILETLKTHLRVSGQEEIHEFRKIAIWFVEKIYTAATSRSDYLQKISLKISQNPIGNALPSNSAGFQK